MQGSRDGLLLDAIDSRLNAESVREELRRSVSDALFDAIGSTAGTHRAALVGLRRSIHNGKIPSRRERSDDVLQMLPGWLRDAIRSLAEPEPNSSTDEAVLKESLQHSLTWLRSAVGEPLLQRGLAQASPVLLDQLRSKPASEWGRRQRVSAARYVTRAVAKTSPYSTFTFTGLAASPTRDGNRAELPALSILELDQYILEQIMHGIGLQPEFQGMRKIRVTPSVEKCGPNLRFLGPPPKESLLQLPHSPQVGHVMKVIGDGTLTVDEVIRELARNDANSEASVTAFVGRLTEIGLLECRLPLDEQDPQVLDRLAKLVRSRRPDSTEAHALTDLAKQISAAAELRDVASHVRRIDSIRNGVAAVAEALSLPWSTEGALRKVAFHENALFDAPLGYPTAFEERQVVTALQDIISWIAVHDRMLPVRIAAYEYARRRFPTRESVPFLEFYRTVQSDLSAQAASLDSTSAEYLSFLRLGRPAPIDSLALSDDDRLQQLHALRGESRALFSGASLRGESVPRAALAELVERYPNWVSPMSSATFYLQASGEEPQSNLVVNVIGAGNGRGRSRWSRLSKVARGLAPESVSTSSEARRRVLEVSGVFGAAGNLRSPTDGLLLDYPHTGSWRHGGHPRVTLPDLQVRFDEHKRLLALHTGGGSDLLPVHSGLMADPLLPPGARFLLAVFGESNALHPAFPLINTLTDAEPPVSGLTLNRVSFSGIVVERAKWVFARADLPITRACLSTISGITDIERWRRRTGIPESVFVRLIDNSTGWREQAFGKARKPMFVDLRSLAPLEAFADQLHSHNGLVVFEEALPDPLRTAPDAYHTEFVAEIGAREQCRC